ncbi:MAG: hypothetical protein L0G22_11725, partial [Propionibacteriaceae bacterium]|nr:hypothetical protein [Propionibacteriaceae bacterium]
MTVTLPPRPHAEHAQPAAPASPADVRAALAARYAAQHRRRTFARDAWYVAAWLLVAVPIGLWLHDGGLAAMTASA